MMRRRLLSTAVALVVTGLAGFGGTVAAAQSYPDATRIVSVGGAVTEIIYALGQEARLVARDTTSNHPAAAHALPDVGYIRRLSPEGVLSVDPDLIITEEGAGPPEAVALLDTAALPMVTIPDGHTPDAVYAKITAVADALGVAPKGAALVDEVRSKLTAAQAATQGQPKKRVLFILSLQGGRIMAGGENTAAQGIITLAGAENAVSGFEGYKLLSDEAVTQSDADVILMMSRAGDHPTTDDVIFGHPALQVLPAAQTQALIRVDGMLLLGFSVRTAEAVQLLSSKLAEVGE